jgi:hypothetical protein
MILSGCTRRPQINFSKHLNPNTIHCLRPTTAQYREPQLLPHLLARTGLSQTSLSDNGNLISQHVQLSLNRVHHFNPANGPWVIWLTTQTVRLNILDLQHHQVKNHVLFVFGARSLRHSTFVSLAVASATDKSAERPSVFTSISLRNLGAPSRKLTGSPSLSGSSFLQSVLSSVLPKACVN